MSFSKKQKFSLDESFSSLSENLSFKLFNRLNYDIYFDMRMSFGHTLLDWKDTNKSFGLSVINHRCVFNMETTTLGFRRSFIFLAQAISSYRRSNILFVSGLPAHDNFQDFLKFHQNNLPLLGHGYMLHWVAGLLTNMGTLIETFWGKATTVVSRYQKQSKRDWFLEAAKGMRIFQRFPDFVVFFSISGIYEIAIKEASLLKIPTLAFVDSNCEVNNIPFSITGNDDFAFGLELKIFLFRELILRTMKRRLFTEIDKLLLESKSLQQFMVDSYMEEFMQEVSKNYKDKLDLKSANRASFSTKRESAVKKCTRNFLRLVFLYSSKCKSSNQLFYRQFGCKKFSTFTKSQLFLLHQKFDFKMSQKQPLKLNKYFWHFKNVLKKRTKITKIARLGFLCKILFFCFKNLVKISQKKLKFLGNCFFSEGGQNNKSLNFFVSFLGVQPCFKSVLFSFVFFSRILFGFVSTVKKIKANFFMKKFKPTVVTVFSALTRLKKKKLDFFVRQKTLKKEPFSKFLQLSINLKKSMFLKSFLFLKLKKVHVRSRLRLYKLFNKYKYKFFSLLKYTGSLQFFPFLRSFFYRQFRRSKYAKHPISALNVCVFFLPKRLFFKRKWYLRSPPFLFKRYTKFFKMKTEVNKVFPKIFPSFHEKKEFNVLLSKTKTLYKKKLYGFARLKKRILNKFTNSSQKMQQNFLIKTLRIWHIWRSLFFLKQYQTKFLPLCFFLSAFSFRFSRFSVFVFFKMKNFLIAALKKAYKALVLSPVFHLIYFEAYFLMKSGFYSISPAKDFIFARFLSFFKIFSGFSLQAFFSGAVLALIKQSVSRSRVDVFLKKYTDNSFLFLLFKRARKNKLYYAKNLNHVDNFIKRFRKFLSLVEYDLKFLKLKMPFFGNFSKNLFSRFLKILTFKLQTISNAKRYVGLRPSFSGTFVDCNKKRGIKILLCNKKFKQARSFYFLNFSKNLGSLSKFNVSKNHINFLKLFVPFN